jgi:predicted nucleic acid-binding protein
MGIIFDSCIWIGLATGQIKQQDVVRISGDDPVFISVISLGELSFGVESCPDPSERAIRAACLRQIERRPSLEVSRHTSSSFGVLGAALKKIGRSPRPRYNDLWIAAQAIEHGYKLLTVNTDDFDGLPGLQILTLNNKK